MSQGRPMQQGNRQVQRAMDGLSKNTLADLVIDLVRACDGADLDGPELLTAILARAETVFEMRNESGRSLRQGGS